MTTHYIYGSGEHGRPYDNGPFYAETRDDAIADLVWRLQLSPRRRAMLRRDLYLDLNPRRDGAAYCEITECDCTAPEDHVEDTP